MAPDQPEKRLCLLECLKFLGTEEANLHQVGNIFDTIEVLRNPVEGVKIPQATLPILDIGLDEISALAGHGMAALTLGKLGLHEIILGNRNDLCSKALFERIEERSEPADIASLQHCRANRMVHPGKPDTFVDRARRMPDLQP